ncbi:MAG: 3-deoxy-manno-octulosonate cytidylyltransferase [bacterium]|nr:3-deoxy-manno-octulosonate cytidylyltransferase [bacterium]
MMSPEDREHRSPRRRQRAVAILPARIGSTRLERKVLLAETGTPLFVHTARNVERCDAIDRVVLATDDGEVRATAMGEGIDVRMTSSAHPSGTDRVREAYEGLGQRFDVVVNVQADEPELEPDDVAALIDAFGDKSVVCATLCAPLDTDHAADAERPDVVKVVRNDAGDALYFSRSPIPNVTRAREGADTAGADTAGAVLRHVGVYAFRPPALARFCDLGPSRLEELESLEQLRWLEAGQSMRVVEIARAPRGIDTREDYEAFVARQRDRASAPSPPSHLEQTETR